MHEIVKWLWDNRQWVFSGIGILAITAIWYLLRRLFRRGPSTPSLSHNASVGAAGTSIQAAGPIGHVEVRHGVSAEEVSQILTAVYSASAADAQAGKEISNLLGKLHALSTPVSACVAEGLVIAKRLRDKSLEYFCENELKGWSEESIDPSDPPHHRLVEAFLAIEARINMDHPAWRRSSRNAYEFMRNNPEDFKPMKISIGQALSQLESRARFDTNDNVVSQTRRVGELFPGISYPNTEVVIYIEPESYVGIIEAVRLELSNRLIRLLPQPKGSEQ